jgi:hypothetical protein
MPVIQSIPSPRRLRHYREVLAGCEVGSVFRYLGVWSPSLPPFRKPTVLYSLTPFPACQRKPAKKLKKVRWKRDAYLLLAIFNHSLSRKSVLTTLRNPQRAAPICLTQAYPSIKTLANLIAYERTTPAPHFVSMNTLAYGDACPPSDKNTLEYGSVDGFHPEFSDGAWLAPISG